MENKTWIKVYRKIKEKGWYQRSQYVHLWVHILIKAEHAEKEFLWNGSIKKTKRGQFLTGRKKLSKETGIPETTIERILELFEKEGQIRQQKNNKFRLITVLNYNEYQTVGQQTDIQRTSSGHIQRITKNNKEKGFSLKSDTDYLSLAKEKKEYDPAKMELIKRNICKR